MSTEVKNSEPLSVVLARNAMNLLAKERGYLFAHRCGWVLTRMKSMPVHASLMNGQAVQADVEDFLANPFVKTAMMILEKLSGNYRVSQAMKLLREAGTVSQQEKKKRRR
jgi:hypothetical protein